MAGKSVFVCGWQRVKNSASGAWERVARAVWWKSWFLYVAGQWWKTARVVRGSKSRGGHGGKVCFLCGRRSAENGAGGAWKIAERGTWEKLVLCVAGATGEK